MHTSRIQRTSIVLLVQGRTVPGYIRHLRPGDARMHTSRLHHALEILVMQRCIAPGHITRLKPGDAQMHTSRPHLALEILLMQGCKLPGYSTHKNMIPTKSWQSRTWPGLGIPRPGMICMIATTCSILQKLPHTHTNQSTTACF